MMPQTTVEKWGWSQLENVLRCPVCYDIPPKAKEVRQCRRGHHVCASCRTQLSNCPMCKSEYFETRNYIAEEIILNLSGLKNTLNINSKILEKLERQKYADKNDEPAHAIVLPTRRRLTTPPSTKGVYPCQVPDCQAELPGGRLLNHVRSCHQDCLLETNIDFNRCYMTTWDLELPDPKTRKPVVYITKILFIRGIGLVFINVECLKSGDLIVAVQMGAKFTLAQSFLARFEFSGNEEVFTYNTRLCSVKTDMDLLLENRRCYILDKTDVAKISSNERTFQCKLVISEYDQLDHSCLSKGDKTQFMKITSKRSRILENSVPNNSPSTTTQQSPTATGQPSDTQPERPMRRKKKRNTHGHRNTEQPRPIAGQTPAAANTQHRQEPPAQPGPLNRGNNSRN